MSEERVAGVSLVGVYASRERGELFRVVGVAEDPTVTLVNVKTGERSHYVIESRLFRERFVELVPRRPIPMPAPAPERPAPAPETLTRKTQARDSEIIFTPDSTEEQRADLIEVLDRVVSGIDHPALHALAVYDECREVEV